MRRILGALILKAQGTKSYAYLVTFHLGSTVEACGIAWSSEAVHFSLYIVVLYETPKVTQTSARS